MNLWRTWLARLGVAGACLVVTGCGGSDVPDPGSDTKAATDTPGAGGNAANVAVAGGAAKADAADAQATPPAQAQGAEAPAAAAQPQGGSTTSEMLAMSKGQSGGSNPPPGGGATPPPGASPGGPAGAPGPGGPGGANMPRGPGAPGGAPGPGPAGGGGMMTMGPGQGINPGSMAGAMAGGMAQQMQKGKMAGAGMPGAGGAGPGGPAQAGGAGGSPADSGPADFNSPEGAVRSFLNALKAKDLDRLNESTALRASVPHEGGSAKNQELFKKIIDLSLSDSELDDLAKKLEGFAVEFDNPQTSTGRIDVVIRKATEHGGYIRRKVTTRREKKGWGVLDIGPSQTFKTPGLILPRKSSGGRR